MSSSSSWAAAGGAGAGGGGAGSSSPPRSTSSSAATATAAASGRRGSTQQAFFGGAQQQTWGGSRSGSNAGLVATTGSLSFSTAASPLTYNSPTKRFGYARWPPLISPTPPDAGAAYQQQPYNPHDPNDDGHADVRLEVERRGHNLTSVMMDPRAPGGVSPELEVRVVASSRVVVRVLTRLDNSIQPRFKFNPTQAALLEQPLPPTPLPSPATASSGLSSTLSGSGALTSSVAGGVGGSAVDDVRDLVQRAGPLLQRYRQNHHAPPEARGYRPEIFAARKATDGVRACVRACQWHSTCIVSCTADAALAHPPARPPSTTGGGPGGVLPAGARRLLQPGF